MFQSMDYIYEIYKTGSFSGAAKRLYMTQPALSIAVKKEERELGLPIFERTSPQVSLTEAGRAYIASVEKIRNIEDSLRIYCNDLSELKQGRIRVGASNFFLSQMVLPIIARFNKLHPGISIDVQEAPSPELKRRLLEEELDLTIDPVDKADSRIVSHWLLDDHLILAAPSSMELNGRLREYALSAGEIRAGRHLSEETASVPLELFSEEPFLLLRPESVAYERAMGICREHGFIPQVRFHLDQLATAYRSSGAGLGVSFLTDTIVKLTPWDENVVFYRLDSPLGKREVSVMHKKNRYVSGAMTEFMNTAKEWVNTEGE